MYDRKRANNEVPTHLENAVTDAKAVLVQKEAILRKLETFDRKLGYVVATSGFSNANLDPGVQVHRAETRSSTEEVQGGEAPKQEVAGHFGRCDLAVFCITRDA